MVLIDDDREWDEYEEYERKKKAFWIKVFLVIMGILILVLSFFVYASYEYNKNVTACKDDGIQAVLKYDCYKPEECYEICASERSLIW